MQASLDSALVRVDNRLVHGQILEAWVPFLRASCIIVVVLFSRLSDALTAYRLGFRFEKRSSSVFSGASESWKRANLK
ncbi:MAG: PTS sugar transporter subunit IIB [Thermodesulfobacteriota bacterium]